MVLKSNWISKFVGQKGHEYFCAIHENFFKDESNLIGLSSKVPFYGDALKIITDNMDDTPNMHVYAEFLYGIMHARYIQTDCGLQHMYEKFIHGDFGSCPRVRCNSQPMVPFAFSNEPGKDSLKLYCYECGEIYNRPEDDDIDIDGAYFGTGFKQIFLSKYPEL